MKYKQFLYKKGRSFNILTPFKDGNYTLVLGTPFDINTWKTVIDSSCGFNIVKLEHFETVCDFKTAFEVETCKFQYENIVNRNLSCAFYFVASYTNTSFESVEVLIKDDNEVLKETSLVKLSDNVFNYYGLFKDKYNIMYFKENPSNFKFSFLVRIKNNQGVKDRGFEIVLKS
jgi:hypothetical protein